MIQVDRRPLSRARLVHQAQLIATRLVRKPERFKRQPYFYHQPARVPTRLIATPLTPARSPQAVASVAREVRRSPPRPRRLEARGRVGEHIEPTYEARMLRPPGALKAQVEVAEGAGERDRADVAEFLRRRRVERAKGAGGSCRFDRPSVFSDRIAGSRQSDQGDGFGLSQPPLWRRLSAPSAAILRIPACVMRSLKLTRSLPAKLGVLFAFPTSVRPRRKRSMAARGATVYSGLSLLQQAFSRLFLTGERIIQ